MSVQALVLKSPGTNCDRETAAALRSVGAVARVCPLGALVEDPSLLRQADVLVLPGGFSFGDDLGAGRVLAAKLVRYLAHAVEDLVARGGLVLGICNGFQALVKAGMLPGGARAESSVTLAVNRSGRFESRWVHLRVETDRSPWLRLGDRLELPVAHGEGRLALADPRALEALTANGQVALRYVEPDGGPARGFPHNPSGSAGAVAGLCDPTGRILGLMPHPERNVAFHHHPAWTRRAPGGPGIGCGRCLFEAAVAALEASRPERDASRSSSSAAGSATEDTESTE